MLLEVMLLADPHLRFSGSGGQLRRLSECPQDMAAYWKLTDSIVKQIETSYSEVLCIVMLTVGGGDTAECQVNLLEGKEHALSSTPTPAPAEIHLTPFLVAAFQELAPARAMIHRLRTRDLFAFAGEIILSAERRTQLQLGGGGATNTIKRQLLELLRERTGSVDVTDADVFCEIVKISYGKGSKNPVSGPTAFYEPKKTSSSAAAPFPAPDADAAAGPGVGLEAVEAVEALSAEEAEARRVAREMVEQNSRWSVGVVPQG